MPQPGIPLEKIDKIIALRQQGYYYKDIRKITGVSMQSISRICKPYESTICTPRNTPEWYPKFKQQWDAMRASVGKT